MLERMKMSTKECVSETISANSVVLVWYPSAGVEELHDPVVGAVVVDALVAQGGHAGVDPLQVLLRLLHPVHVRR